MSAADFEPIVGRYLNVELLDRPQRDRPLPGRRLRSPMAREVFTVVGGDLRGRLGDIPAWCPLFILSGKFDYSCTPEDTLKLAQAVPTPRPR
jgi:hypothetical protein